MTEKGISNGRQWFGAQVMESGTLNCLTSLNLGVPICKMGIIHFLEKLIMWELNKTAL